MIAEFATLEESIEIAASPSAVFAQWTRFEEFPRFMEGVLEVARVGERLLRWRGEFAGEVRAWESNITVLIPGHRIAWRATSAGAHSSRAVCIESAEGGRTRLTLKMLVDPGEAWARMPSMNEISSRLQRNLVRFKALLEAKTVLGESSPVAGGTGRDSHLPIPPR